MSFPRSVLNRHNHGQQVETSCFLRTIANLHVEIVVIHMHDGPEFGGDPTSLSAHDNFQTSSPSSRYRMRTDFLHIECFLPWSCSHREQVQYLATARVILNIH
jgi:hypothetical protein